MPNLYSLSFRAQDMVLHSQTPSVDPLRREVYGGATTPRHFLIALSAGPDLQLFFL